MPMVRLGSADCQCFAPPCPCDMEVVYNESDCPVGTRAERIWSETAPGTTATTVMQYRCMPTSPVGSSGIHPSWMLIGAAAVAVLLLFGGGEKEDN